MEEVESLLTMLILDGRIEGKMDQVDQTLELARFSDSALGRRRLETMHAWSNQLHQLAMAVSAKQGTCIPALTHSVTVTLQQIA